MLVDDWSLTDKYVTFWLVVYPMLILTNITRFTEAFATEEITAEFDGFWGIEVDLFLIKMSVRKNNNNKINIY